MNTPTRAIRPGATWRYTLEADRPLPRDDRPIFILRHLTHGERNELELLLLNGMPEEGEKTTGPLGLSIARVKRGLRGWERFCWEDDPTTPVPFVAADDGTPTDETLAALSKADLIELGNAIEQSTRVTEEDSKN